MTCENCEANKLVIDRLEEKVRHLENIHCEFCEEKDKEIDELVEKVKSLEYYRDEYSKMLGADIMASRIEDYFRIEYFMRNGKKFEGKLKDILA